MQLLFVTKQTYTEISGDDPSSYVGAWKSAGGFIRHELLPDGRYVKQRGSHPTAAGRYRVADGRIAYETEDGRRYDGEFAEGALHQWGMIFYKVN